MTDAERPGLTKETLARAREMCLESLRIALFGSADCAH